MLYCCICSICNRTWRIIILKKYFNSQVLVEIISYLLLGGCFLYLVISGKYLSFVTPRMKKYIIFTVIIMLIWTVSSFRYLFTRQYKKRSVHCLTLIIPVIMLILPLKPLTSLSDAHSNGIYRANS